jgi:hypothetical protein
MERANRDIKDVNTNFKQGLEANFMKKYLQHVHAQDYIKGFSARIFNNSVMMNVLSSLLPGVADSFDDDEASLGPNLGSNTQRFDLATFINHSTDDARLVTGSEPLPPSFYSHKYFDRSVVMNSSHFQCLLDFYKYVYNQTNYAVVQYRQSQHRIASTIAAINKIKKFTEIDLLGQKIRSNASRSKRGIYIEAFINGEFRVGRVAYFFSHVVRMPVPQKRSTTEVTHIFAFVEWFKKSPHLFTSFNAHHAFVWQSNFESIDQNCILPVHRIHTCVATEPHVENTMISVSLPRKIVNTF